MKAVTGAAKHHYDLDTTEYSQPIEWGSSLDAQGNAIMATTSRKDLTEQTLTFAYHAHVLEKLPAWLQNQGVSHVATENTGGSRKPVRSECV